MFNQVKVKLPCFLGSACSRQTKIHGVLHRILKDSDLKQRNSKIKNIKRKKSKKVKMTARNKSKRKDKVMENNFGPQVLDQDVTDADTHNNNFEKIEVLSDTDSDKQTHQLKLAASAA